jgi:hypothetical protein
VKTKNRQQGKITWKDEALILRLRERMSGEPPQGCYAGSSGVFSEASPFDGLLSEVAVAELQRHAVFSRNEMRLLAESDSKAKEKIRASLSRSPGMDQLDLAEATGLTLARVAKLCRDLVGENKIRPV